MLVRLFLFRDQGVADFAEEFGVFVVLFLFGLFLFGFFGGEFGFGGLLEFVEGADDEKDDKGDDEEIDDAFDEETELNLGGFAGAEEAGNGDREMAEVDATDEHTDDRHDDVVHQGGDNGAESATNDDTDSEIDDVAAVNEFLEFFDNGWFFGLKFLEIKVFEALYIWFFHEIIISCDE